MLAYAARGGNADAGRCGDDPPAGWFSKRVGKKGNAEALRWSYRPASPFPRQQPGSFPPGRDFFGDRAKGPDIDDPETEIPTFAFP